jgi:hypothetical protein
MKNVLTVSALALCLLAASSQAAPVIENDLIANSGSGNANPIVNTSFTTDASVNYLVVLVTGEYSGGTDVTSVTYDGVDLDELGMATSGSGSQQKVWIYGMAMPNTGDHSLVITPSGFGVPNGGFDYAAYGVSGVDTGVAAVFNGTGADSGDTTDLTVNLPAQALNISGNAVNDDADITGSLSSVPSGSGATFVVDGEGIATGNQASRAGFGHFSSDLAGDYTITYNHASKRNALAALTLVPEPATMSLLGLGGLVALRRRRR